MHNRESVLCKLAPNTSLKFDAVIPDSYIYPYLWLCPFRGGEYWPPCHPGLKLAECG